MKNRINFLLFSFFIITGCSGINKSASFLSVFNSDNRFTINALNKSKSINITKEDSYNMYIYDSNGLVNVTPYEVTFICEIYWFTDDKLLNKYLVGISSNNKIVIKDMNNSHEYEVNDQTERILKKYMAILDQ